MNYHYRPRQSQVMKSYFFYLFITLVAVLLPCHHAFSAKHNSMQKKEGFKKEVKIHNQNNWQVFEHADNGYGRSFCYMVATPIKSSGNYDKRGESFFLVVKIKGGDEEISHSSGFIYDENSEVELAFDDMNFYLFPYNAMAWADNRNQDLDIIKEMTKNKSMRIVGVSQAGRFAIDTYSLAGFAESYKQMDENCS